MDEETRCIICGLKKDGIGIKEDYIINIIRWVKRNITRNEKGYRLVVCRECYSKYKKAHDSYMRKEITYIAIGVVFAALLIIFSGGRELSAILFGVLIIIFMYLLAQLSYMPALKLPLMKEQQAGALKTFKVMRKKQ